MKLNILRLFWTLIILIFMVPQLGLAGKSRSKKVKVTPEKVILIIAKDVRESKTVGQWINRGDKKTKRFRRAHFKKYRKKKFPIVIPAGNTLIVYDQGSKKPPSILKAFQKGKQFRFTWNGQDFSRKPNESMNSWYKRFFTKKVKKKRRKKKSASIIDFIFESLIGEAYAAQNDNPYTAVLPSFVDNEYSSYWTSIIGAMANEEHWWKADLSKFELGEELIRVGQFLKNNFNLACGADNKMAYFDYYGLGSDIEADPIRVATHYDHTAKLARVSFRRRNHLAEFPQGEVARIAYKVHSEQIMTTVNGKLDTFGGQETEAYFANPQNLDSARVQGMSSHHSTQDPVFLRNLYLTLGNTTDYILADPGYSAGQGDLLYNTSRGMEGLEAFSDFARACCSNKQCSDGGSTGNPLPRAVGHEVGR